MASSFRAKLSRSPPKETGESVFEVNAKSIEDDYDDEEDDDEDEDDDETVGVEEDMDKLLVLKDEEEEEPEDVTARPISSCSDEFEDAREHLSPVKQPPETKTAPTNQDPQAVFMSDAWRFQKKHIFILSDAGKPIYSLNGDETELSSLMAVIQAQVAFVEDMNDQLRSMHYGNDCSIVFLTKKPLILCIVNRGGLATDTQLIVQLTYMYHQILSVLTLAQLNWIFEKRKNYDLRHMIRGCERLMDSLAHAMDTDPSFMLSGIRVLQLPFVTRDAIASTVSQRCGKIKNVVFVILLIENKLVALVRKKDYFIHPADLHLLFNLVNSSESFKHAESWTPVCLPKFNSR